jgi:hypothetical protein
VLRRPPRCWAGQVRWLITSHPDTLSFRNNLAAAYHDLGDVQRAIPLYERVLADRQRVLGDDHPDTLASRDSIAGYLQRSVKPARRGMQTKTPWPGGTASLAPTTPPP